LERSCAQLDINARADASISCTDVMVNRRLKIVVGRDFEGAVQVGMVEPRVHIGHVKEGAEDITF
jgi:hypothetical protein